ncbi:pyridoxamine 5'-phosphate oxidase family protein [Acidimicrobiaceae bacterium AH-315-P05]|nr:pyridoxamine 5'-phosphate oxidase family protein [Acidimicrobiaceae bacterium AH-315-P05]
MSTHQQAKTATAPFSEVVGTVADLRALYREPSAVVQAKSTRQLDGPSRGFVARSTFVLVGTTDGHGGTADVSPRGGPPGFVKVIDDQRIVIPDLNGNNRIDTLANIIDSPQVGLLLLVPGNGETLRINGRAVVTVADEVLDLFDSEFRRPRTAIGIEIDEVFLHCAKSIRRGGLWQPDTWNEAPISAGEILVAALGDEADFSAAEADAGLAAGYAHDLALDAPGP